MEVTVGELALLVGGEVRGRADVTVRCAAAVADAVEGDVVLAEDARFFDRASRCGASCIIASARAGRDCPGKSVIVVGDPGGAFAVVLRHFAGREPQPDAGVGPGAVVARGASLGRGAAIGANCYIGSGASVGDGCVIYPNAYVGDGVSIGEGTVVHPGVVIYRNCRIGRRVTLHAGVVIGADGFGYRPGCGEMVKLPHIGAVEIGDGVEIGANSTVDRAKTGVTVIGAGTKIDNLVHIAHNVRIGSNCVIVALSGVAGSVRIGDNVTLAAQTGIKDHVVIGDGCVVAARAGVIGSLADGSVVSGFPARDHRTEKRAQAARLRLPEMMERLRALEDQVKELRAEGKSTDDDDANH